VAAVMASIFLGMTGLFAIGAAITVITGPKRHRLRAAAGALWGSSRCDHFRHGAAGWDKSRRTKQPHCKVAGIAQTAGAVAR
jgi:hypothetical protein